MSISHPQYQKDRQALNELIQGGPSDFNLAELARLLVRYQDFPGAEDLQRDLRDTLKSWKLTEQSLFERTRAIHWERPVYRNADANQEDWL